MNFLAAVIALVLFRMRAGVRAVQRDDWFLRWRRRVAGWQLVPWMGLALAVLAPALVAAGVLDALDDMLFGLPWIAATVVLLLYAFGRGDLGHMQSRYRMQCQSGDFEAAVLEVLPDRDAEGQPSLESAQDVHRAVQQVLFYEAFQRWFAVLFYFVIVGPAAALAYRLLQLCRDEFEAPLVERVLLVVDWVPARLLAGTFAVAGDLVRSRAVLLDAVSDGGRNAASLIYEVGAAASAVDSGMGDEGFNNARAVEEHEEAADLIARSAAVWLAGLALLVLVMD